MSQNAVEIVRDVKSLRSRVAAWRAQGLTVGLIPTMGALHAGHMSLVAAALAAYDRAVATLFVNPRQFNSPEDLANYPRTEVSDAAKLAAVGAHLLYAPDGAVMYPEGYATNISVSGVSAGLCGADRPGHFDGVATVCTKLFLQSGADGAFFGEKDYQQLMVVRRFVEDLNIPIRIHPCPTVREADGLALSSRNARLSNDERALAGALPRALRAAAEAVRGGADAPAATARAEADILAGGFRKVDYVELRRGADLRPIAENAADARIFAAAWLGNVRLIDNMPVNALPPAAD